jgi:hypothetical protein
METAPITACTGSDCYKRGKQEDGKFNHDLVLSLTITVYKILTLEDFTLTAHLNHTLVRVRLRLNSSRFRTGKAFVNPSAT